MEDFKKELARFLAKGMDEAHIGEVVCIFTGPEGIQSVVSTDKNHSLKLISQWLKHVTLEERAPAAH